MAGESKFPVAVVITAVDRISATMRQITDRIAKVTAPISGVGKSLGALSKEVGLNSLVSAIGEAGGKASKFADEVQSLGLRLFAIGAGASFAAYRLIRGFTDAGDSALKASQKMGLNVETLQAYRYAGSLADVSSEQLDGAFLKLSRHVGEAAAGNAEAALTFQALGISLKDGQGKLKTLDSILPAVTEKLGAMSNANIRNLFLTRIFGKEGAQLGVLFKDGAKGIAAATAEARQFGIVMDKETAEASERFNDDVTRLGAAFRGVQFAIASAVLPELNKLAAELTSWLSSNRAEVARWAKQFAAELPQRIAEIRETLKSLWAAFQTIAHVVGYLADRFGAGNVALAAFAATMGRGAVLSAIQLAGALGKVTWAMGSVLARAAVFSLGAVVASIQAFIYALGSGIGVVEAFNFALWANPIGVIILAITALAAAAYLIYRNWQPIKKFFLELWDTLESVFKKIEARLPGLVGAFLPIVNAIRLVSGFISGGSAPVGGPVGGGSESLSSFGVAPAADRSRAASFGVAKTVDAATTTATVRQENTLRVLFENMPRGTRVESGPGGIPMDVSRGYSLSTP